jgi:hypothetical protein
VGLTNRTYAKAIPDRQRQYGARERRSGTASFLLLLLLRHLLLDPVDRRLAVLARHHQLVPRLRVPLQLPEADAG